jgi:hypothetical protein
MICVDKVANTTTRESAVTYTLTVRVIWPYSTTDLKFKEELVQAVVRAIDGITTGLAR